MFELIQNPIEKKQPAFILSHQAKIAQMNNSMPKLLLNGKLCKFINFHQTFAEEFLTHFDSE